MNDSVWERNYQAGRYNRYPHDAVVSFVLSRFGDVPDRKAVRILDLGCGGGNNTKFLYTEGFDAYAIDGSPKSVELARHHIAGLGDPERITQGYFEDLPYADDFFDCIIDRQSVGHNPAAKLDCITAEILRVLKSSGVYFGLIFSAAHPHRWFGQALNDDSDMAGFDRGTFTKSGLVHFFTVSEIVRRFSAFVIEDIVTYTSRSLYGPAESSDNGDWFLIKAAKPGHDD